MDAIIWMKILVLAAVWFGLGAFWYSPAGFGKPWMAAIGKTQDELRAEGAPMLRPMLVSALVCFVQTAALGFVVGHLKIESVVMAGLTGFMMAASFGLLSQLRGHAFWPRGSRQLIWIDNGYDLVAATVIGGLLSWWL